MKCWVYTNEWLKVAEGQGGCSNRVFTSKKEALEAMNADVRDFEKLSPKAVAEFDTVDRSEMEVSFYSKGFYWYAHQRFLVEETEIEGSPCDLLDLHDWLKHDIEYLMLNDNIDPSEHRKLVERLTDELVRNEHLWAEYDRIMYDCLENDKEYRWTVKKEALQNGKEKQ